MKLRIRGNSLRLRLNQTEVGALSEGQALKEQVEFPGNSTLAFSIESHPEAGAKVVFADDCIQIKVPSDPLAEWATSDEIGLYYTLSTGGSALRISIEKDLECIDGPADEKDPDAFPRELSEKVC